MITGYTIPLRSPPPLSLHPPSKWAILVTQAAGEELYKLLLKGCLVPVDPKIPGLYSHTFTIPKKSGERRLIINLKTLNQHVPHDIVHFKVENIQQLQDIRFKRSLLLDPHTHNLNSFSGCGGTTGHSVSPVSPIACRALPEPSRRS